MDHLFASSYTRVAHFKNVPVYFMANAVHIQPYIHACIYACNYISNI